MPSLTAHAIPFTRPCDSSAPQSHSMSPHWAGPGTLVVLVPAHNVATSFQPSRLLLSLPPAPPSPGCPHLSPLVLKDAQLMSSCSREPDGAAPCWQLLRDTGTVNVPENKCRCQERKAVCACRSHTNSASAPRRRAAFPGSLGRQQEGTASQWLGGGGGGATISMGGTAKGSTD